MASTLITFEIPTTAEALAVVLRACGELRARGMLVAASPEPFLTPESAPFWRYDVRVTRDERAYTRLLECLAEVNTYCLSVWHLPPLYLSGLRFIPQPLGVEIWRCNVAVYHHGGGDCDNLSGARVAELRRDGVRARCQLNRMRRHGSAVAYHVTVALLDNRGRVTAEEDPTLLVGG